MLINILTVSRPQTEQSLIQYLIKSLIHCLGCLIFLLMLPNNSSSSCFFVLGYILSFYNMAYVHQKQ